MIVVGAVLTLDPVLPVGVESSCHSSIIPHACPTSVAVLFRLYQYMGIGASRLQHQSPVCSVECGVSNETQKEDLRVLL